MKVISRYKPNNHARKQVSHHSALYTIFYLFAFFWRLRQSSVSVSPAAMGVFTMTMNKQRLRYARPIFNFIAMFSPLLVTE